MKALLAKWAGLTKRGKVLASVAAIIILLVVIGGIATVVAGDAVTEITGSFLGADSSTIHLYPSSACLAVGDTMYVNLYGWAWGAAKWGSDNSNIATAPADGQIHAVASGTTHMNLKGSAGVITMKEVPVTVKATMAECASTYWSGFTFSTPDYTPGGSSTGAAGTGTAPVNNFKFVFVSDTQGCPGCSAAGGPDLVDHDFARWFGTRMINVENPAFIVNGGDLSGLGGLGTQYGTQWLDDIASAWKRGSVPAGKTAIPIYAVVGNHDLTRVVLGESWKSKQDDWKGVLWPWYVSNGGKAWPTNVAESYKGLAYSFIYGNSVFIMTDDLYMWGNSGNDNDWQGNMYIQEASPEQIAFASQQIKSAKDKGKVHAFVFGHAPMTHDLKDNMNLFKHLLSESGVSGGYFGGHSGGLQYAALGGTFKAFTAETGGGDKNPNSYLRVEVNGNAWTVTAVSRAHDGTVTEGTAAAGTKWSFTQ